MQDLASLKQLVYREKVGVISVGKIWVEFAGVVEYLEGEVKIEVEVLLTTNHQNDAIGGDVGARVCLGE